MLYHALATIERGAVGNHAVAITNELKNSGIEVEIYAETIREEFEESVKDINVLADILRPEDTVLYQFANPSIMADLLYEKPCKLIVNYHCVTPAHFFSRWDPGTSQIIARARLQLARLAEVADSAIAVSEYNAQELNELGYKNIEIIPPVFSNAFYETAKKERDYSHAHWLYVGRIAPHKNIHTLLRAFEYYRNHIDSNAKLTIVGSSDVPTYSKAINELIDMRNFGDSLSIVQNASINDLVDIYSQSTVFVTASQHEGFCVPLVEAMAADLPVVAVAQAAVGDTVSSAGIVFKEPDYVLIAHGVQEIHENNQFRDDLISKGIKRAGHFDPRKSVLQYARYIGSLS